MLKKENVSKSSEDEWRRLAVVEVEGGGNGLIYI